MTYRASIQAKIMSRAQLEAQVQAWQAQGQQVVFTNGCFDLLHYGHVDYLNRAADLGDRLVVALNADQSVAKLKGPTRPIQNEASRGLVMASLACVSALCFFEDETPLALIKMLKPAVLVKGADYALTEIVGAAEVCAAGGRVETITLSEGYSTTAIEARIKG